MFTGTDKNTEFRTRVGLGWGPVRVGALSGLGPIWALMGPYGPDFVQKILILIKNHKILDKDIEVVKLEILKVKMWFCDKDLSS